MKKTFTLLLAILCLPALAVPREDVLECQVADGSKFVLKSKYDWSPQARFLREAAERINQTPYKIFYQDKHSSTLTAVHRSVSATHEKRVFPTTCSAVGVLHGHPLVLFGYSEAGTWHRLTPEAEQKLYVEPIKARQTEQLRSELEGLSSGGKNAFPELDYAFIVPLNGRLVFEHPVLRDDLVVAVFKSESQDKGSTWQELTLTANAEIFEIGKTLLEQSFIGRPRRFNRKEIE